MSKQLPKFKKEDEKREFWATHDSTEFIMLTLGTEYNQINQFRLLPVACLYRGI